MAVAAEAKPRILRCAGAGASGELQGGGEQEDDEPDDQRAPEERLEARERVLARGLAGTERRASDGPVDAGDRVAEPHAERARAAGEDDAFFGPHPLRRLRTPAEQRVLEIADHREGEGGESLRDPVDGVKGASGEPSEVAL